VWVIGVVTYCGNDTKLVHNQRAPPSKFSQLDKKLNIAVICIFAFNFACLVFLTVVSYVFEKNIPDHWYIGRDPKSSVFVWAIKIFFG
jgi:phospholipid-transporting ATPase